jgi:hypothetical protein
LTSLEARANPGWTFSHWVGEVAEKHKAETVIRMDKVQIVTAIFVPSGSEAKNLSLLMPNGQVYIIGQPIAELPKADRIVEVYRLTLICP